MEVIVGVVGKAHGLKGEVAVYPHTDDIESRFAIGSQLRVAVAATQKDAHPSLATNAASGSQYLQVAARHSNAGILFVCFAQVTDRSRAEELRGATLWCEASDEPEALDAEEFHDQHLIGLEARNDAGENLGRVIGVRHLLAQDVLVVQVDAQERLVPFVAELVPVVDVAAGFLQINAIPGLLDDHAA